MRIRDYLDCMADGGQRTKDGGWRPEGKGWRTKIGGWRRWRGWIEYKRKMEDGEGRIEGRGKVSYLNFK